MKNTIISICLLAIASIGAHAQESDPSEQISDQWAAAQATRAVHEARLAELEVIIADEMATIRSMPGGSGRQALMAAHREHMLEALGLMHELGDDNLRDVIAHHAGPRSASEEDRLTAIEDRLDMMLVMMQSMIGCADDPAGC